MAAGAPTKYKPEYCQELITHMASGLSFETFSAVIHVNQDTLYEWAKVHPAFSEAKKLAYEQNRLFWEKIGITGMAGKIEGFNATIWIFNMKNRFRWRDVQHQQISAKSLQPGERDVDDAEQLYRSDIDNSIRDKIELGQQVKPIISADLLEVAAPERDAVQLEEVAVDDKPAKRSV